jgi:perosamine synthetase
MVLSMGGPQHETSTPDGLIMSAPDIDASDEQAVLAAMRSGALGLGPRAEEFERLCAKVADRRYGVAVSSGTAALHVLTHALGLTADDEVLVPSFTFAATVNAVLYVGATPVFCDIEPDTYNVDPAEIRAKRTERTKSVLGVDVFGHPADWDAIADAAEGLVLLDDSCEAIGARYRGRPAGSFGEAGCFAFYPNKQITTGEGGMIVTDDERLASLCRSLRNQGRDEMGAWLEHDRLGFNYRLDELSAALGVSQITRLPAILAKRADLAARYTERIGSVSGVRPPTVRADVDVSWFVYVVTLEEGIDRDAIIRELAKRGVPSRAYFSPIHRQPYVARAIEPVALPVTEDICRRTLALPFHTNLDEASVELVVESLRDVL